VSKLLSLLKGKEKGYPRPAPSALWDQGWVGCARVAENGWTYSAPDYFSTEAEADVWSVDKVNELTGKKEE